ncbi:MAG: beta-mannosidase [Rhodococcus sp. (in: high G+C Gram-positive bacteria)]
MTDLTSWRLSSTAPGTCAHPRDLPEDAQWLPATVPGTVASALPVADRLRIDDQDWWYVTTVVVPAGPAHTLNFDGVATRATVWINDTEVARIRSMFCPEVIELAGGIALPEGSGEVSIAVRVESMSAQLQGRRPRGRWRSSLIAQQGLRHERATLLGRAPVYGDLPVPVGLWRPVILRPHAAVRDVRAHTTVEDGHGLLRLRGELDGPATVAVSIGDESVSVAADAGPIEVTVQVPNAELWWPHTHGDPTLHTWTLAVDGRQQCTGQVGFRTVALDRTGSAVTFEVNGVRVFARGGCWVPPDPIRLWIDAEQMRSELERVRGAGLNMIRVVGTLVYEQPEFWSLCAELGILVWQDIMFATTDPPEDEGFVHAVEGELAALTRLVGGNPALAVISGGSETQQQPTMLGIPAEGQRMPLLESRIPGYLAEEIPGTPYVTSSPSSSTGELHTHVGDGIAHYFGVGGYLRPLSDVRSARVRFAAECLAFAIPPERRAVDAMFGTANVAGHHPDWKAAVPRDRGSSWDFEDVRDHYVKEIFAVDPHQVRRDDAELYLDYGRAAVCEAVTSSYMHWRRAGSECAGALVLTLRDLVPGAGWGLLDSAGLPKAPWYSLARLSRPVTVFLVDDGLDGLRVELVDDTAEAFRGTLRVSLYGVADAVAEVHFHPVAMEPHSAVSVSLDRIIGSFTDVNHSYRFGSQTYAAVVAELIDAQGQTAAEATHLIGEQHPRQHDVGLAAEAEQLDPCTWTLTVSTQWSAHYVCVDVAGFEISDSWFHLAPGASRTLTLTGSAKPSGHVRALNSTKRAQIR